MAIALASGLVTVLLSMSGVPSEARAQGPARVEPAQTLAVPGDPWRTSVVDTGAIADGVAD